MLSKYFIVSASIFCLSTMAFSQEEMIEKYSQNAIIADSLAYQMAGFVEAKLQSDYESKKKSIEGLLQAHQRITALNSDLVKETELQKKIKPLLRKSNELAQKHLFREAKSLLDEAYIMIVSSIKSQRTGQTLVRSLDFKTDQEAYEYEIGRYENYKMLVNMMIDERHAFARDERTQPFFDQANDFYQQAQALAAQKKYGQAAHMVEQASKSLVNLLRNMGIYIPGV